MADAIRKPWLLAYLLSYAEQHGGQLSSLQPKKGKVQIINFRTLPETPDEWLWADVSDKQHAVPVRFTTEAVQAFNKDFRNEGRRLTSRRWGIASVRCVRPLLCRPPSQNGKGLEEKWTLAVEVDQVEVAASEGEVMFGEPKDVSKEESIQRWIEGLREPHGAGGNVLKLERLDRDREQKAPHTVTDEDEKFQTNHRRLDSISKAETHASRVNEGSKKHDGKLQRWKKKMTELGLVVTHKSCSIPEIQMKQLSEITVFGLGSSASDISAAEERGPEKVSSPERAASLHDVFMGTGDPSKSTPTSMKVVPGPPTTPSHWSASQRTHLSKDEDTSEDVVQQEYQIEKQNSGQENIPSEEQQHGILEGNEGVKSQYKTFQQNGEEKMDVDECLGNSGPHPPPPPDSLTRCKQMSPTMLVRSQYLAPAILSTHEPVILAPDSDVSGSQSHTQSQSLTQHSVSQPPSDQHGYHKAKIPKLSPNNTILEPSHPQGRSTVRLLSSVFNSNSPQGNVPVDDTVVTLATNKHQSSASSCRTDSGTLPLKREGTQSPSQYIRSPVATTSLEGYTTSQKPLKLGGWHPRYSVATGLHIMTWERFNRMLLTVGREREAEAQRKSEL